MPDAIYLSPHLDDAVYSCGGLIAQQVQQGGSVTVVTIFAGDPPPGPRSDLARQLEARWGTADDPIETRRAEDLAACGRLGAAAVHIGLVEALYRVNGADGSPLYPTEESLFGPTSDVDDDLDDAIAEVLTQVVPPGAQVYAPLAAGGHVDHQLLRRACEQLASPVWFFHDLPYAARAEGLPARLAPSGAVASVVPLKQDLVAIWAQACWDYTSQRSSFWDRQQDVQVELQAFLNTHHGLPIWAPAGPRRRA